MNRILKNLALLALLVAASVGFAADGAKNTADNDPILRSLQEEMARSKAQLKLENMPAPYFIDYRVLDVDDWEADAALGSLRSEDRVRVRFLMVQVRIGDYKQDNSSARGEGAVELVPLDQDDQAFRFQVWSATDKAYKQAVEALTDKQARLKQLSVDHPVDDFARATPVESVQPVASLKVEREPWVSMLREASAVYRTDPKVQFLDANLSFKAVNRYYLNSEGTVVRSGGEIYSMSISGTTQAADGMNLDRSNGFEGKTLAAMPKSSEFVARARKMVASLKELREAPLADEEYHGPVLLSADSAATVFASLVGANVLGTKPELGQNARVRGQFASSYKTRVLPEFLSVSDDPSLTEVGGETLLGHYAIDDEGVKAERVPVIEKGVLVNYLLGREPIRDFPLSNGHSRFGGAGWPAPGLGNLVVHADVSSTPAELKQKLIAMCKDRGLDFGYYAETMGGYRAPRLLHRVWVKDGHEELVRGGLFGDLDPRSMRSNIVAAGNDQYVENHTQPYLYSVTAPSILLDDLEVKRQTTNKDKLPVYPSPEEAAK
jgi:predicted Zn-dependent protease